jgi:hypothetical protein
MRGEVPTLQGLTVKRKPNSGVLGVIEGAPWLMRQVVLL